VVVEEGCGWLVRWDEASVDEGGDFRMAGEAEWMDGGRKDRCSTLSIPSVPHSQLCQRRQPQRRNAQERSARCKCSTPRSMPEKCTMQTSVEWYDRSLGRNAQTSRRPRNGQLTHTRHVQHAISLDMHRRRPMIPRPRTIKRALKQHRHSGPLLL